MPTISLHSLARRSSRLGLAGLISLAGLAALPPARAGMVENMILSKCSEAMAADFQKSGKTAPPGAISDTCNCVLTRWQQKFGLNTAIQTCSADATTKYGLGSTSPSTPASK